jgi:hypothetical protein
MLRVTNHEILLYYVANKNYPNRILTQLEQGVSHGISIKPFHKSHSCSTGSSAHSSAKFQRGSRSASRQCY